MNLKKDHIMMGQVAKDKAQALALLGRAVFEQGMTVNNYTEALSLREAQVSTYLGAGIAIPHGLSAFKDDVVNTGVVAAHFSDGVDWGDGETVYLAVAIAATSDEHLSVLRHLALALDDEEGVKQALMTASSEEEILALLGVTSSEASLLLVEQHDSTAQDGEQLLAEAVRLLETAQAVDDGFLSTVATKPWLHIAPHIHCLQESYGVRLPAAAFISTNHLLKHNNKPLQSLLLIAGHERLDKQKLGEFIEQITTGIRYEEATVTLPNRHGLHARPAAALAKLAASLRYEVSVCANEGAFVPANSLTKLLSLGAEAGATLRFRTQRGNDLTVLVQAVKDGLGETDERQPPHKPTPLQADPPAQQATALVRGKPSYAVVAAGGVALAKAWVVGDKSHHFDTKSDRPSDEIQRLTTAWEQANNELAELATVANQEVVDIVLAHQAILSDEVLRGEVLDKIKAGYSAEAAWHDTITDLAATQALLDNPLLAERAADFKDVGQRVLAILLGEKKSRPTGAYILVKEDLLPSDVLGVSGELVGVITALGSKNSHSAIIARSLGIPALVGAGMGVLAIDGELVLLDAQGGYLVVDPDEDSQSVALEQQTALLLKAKAAKMHAKQPATTQDGHTLKVMANLGEVSQAQTAKDNGAEGVGLLRTEFVFMHHDKLPNKQTQIDDYRQVFLAMGDYPVVARTLDVGGDKPLPYLTMKAEDNPFLGVRGVRLCLQRPELLREQLTALLVAGKGHRLRIMFPMIGQIEEWQQAKAMVDELLQTYPHDDVQVGMMIEVPSAAIMADAFAPYVDFFSIGTNDLTQYVLAIDRGHPILADKADGLHPSVLRLIDMTVKAAHAHGKWVGVCGELGADEAAIAILMGLGVDELSVSSAQIASVKAHIRTLTFSHCQTLAAKALHCSTAAMVRTLVNTQEGV